MTVEPALRVAELGDAAAISELMRDSARALFAKFYDERQAESGTRFIASLDEALLRDRTYFLLEAAGELVACGGWSRRDKLFTGPGDALGDTRLLDPETEPARIRAMFVRPDWTRRGLGRRILDACAAAARAEGFQRLALMATLPGEPLYLAYGFTETDRTDIRLPDGVTLRGVRMELGLT
ncbi:MAG: GNAT family N-acetyltransferase [Myxococcales bacterium]|nr:GNAT family N-acetyltransferase [Myxococcales bacterium]